MPTTFLTPALVALGGPDRPDVTLVLLPGAGNGPSAFAPWVPAAPDGWRLVAACLPGRGQRIGEPVPGDLPTAADEVAEAIRGEIGGPLVLCGHSMGALLGLEIAHRVPAALLAVAACTPPDEPPDYSNLDDTTIRALVRDQLTGGGITDPAMLAELAGLAAAMLRADLEMLDGYTAPTTPLGCPIVAYYGHDDDVEPVSWARHTTAGAGTVRLPGGHRFCHDDPARLLSDLTARATTLIPTGTGRPADAEPR